MFLLLILGITLEMRHEQSRHDFLSLDFCLPDIMKIFPYVFFQVFLPSHLDLLFTWNWLLLDWFYSIYMGSLEKAMANHSSTLAWKIPWTEEPDRLQSMGSLGVRHDWATSLSLFTFMHWRGNGNPLQYSRLEDPRDGEPGGLPSMGPYRVRHDWRDLAAAAAAHGQLIKHHWLKIHFTADWY